MISIFKKYLAQPIIYFNTYNSVWNSLKIRYKYHQVKVRKKVSCRFGYVTYVTHRHIRTLQFLRLFLAL